MDKVTLLKNSLIDSHLVGADLEGVDLSDCDLSFLICIGANFANSDLEGANFSGTNLEGANFASANLAFAELIDAKIRGANFESADLEGVNFEGTDAEGANFEDTKLEANYILKSHFHATHSKDLNVVNSNLSKTNHEDYIFSDPILNATKSSSSEEELDDHNFNKTTMRQRAGIKKAEEESFVDLSAVNPNMIEEAIVYLIDKIKSNVQIDRIQSLCKHQNFGDRIDKIDFKNGDIVTHKNQIAFKLDCNISYNLSLLIDRNGKLIKFSSQS